MDPVVMFFLGIFGGSLLTFLLLAVRHRRRYRWRGGALPAAAIRETVGEMAIGPYGPRPAQLKVHILAASARQPERLALETQGVEGEERYCLMVALSMESAARLLELLRTWSNGALSLGEVAVESFGGRPARLRLGNAPSRDGKAERLALEVRGRGIWAWHRFTIDLDNEQAQCLISYLRKALANPGAPARERRRNSPMRKAWVQESRRWYADEHKN